MGNTSSKDLRSTPGSEAQRTSNPPHSSDAAASQPDSSDRYMLHVASSRNGAGRSSRHELPFLSLGRDRDQPPIQAERPRETKQEREARRAERERQARVRERERSLREEGVDGGYLVTLGTYTGPEDFSKSMVRQLQIERRLAPFWKGLNDHDDAWTEAQLVAAVRGLPIPAADEVPSYAEHAVVEPTSVSTTRPGASSLAVPIAGTSHGQQADPSVTHLSASQPAFSTPAPGTSSATLLRGRAKTLASLATGGKLQSQDLVPQEIRLPHEPNVNGVPIEAYLYNEASECPICFLYYPPYLNRTRCCDQPICSECFVQIKRPDPHPPEHEQPGQTRAPEEEAEMLVSEVAACPFCVTPEFGVTYDAPPFRRGLSYANQGAGTLRQLKNPTSALSSSTSISNSTPGRRRATSLSASAPQVITTDKVRPDWAKKLADARAHALRRSAAATALHNAAYVLGNPGDAASRGTMAFGRRRRTMFSDSPGGSTNGSGTPQAAEDGGSDLFPGRISSRRNRVDDLEDLMMMEAIRLSLVAEEERKRKEEKEARKEEKKRGKEIKKEAKQAEKVAKKNSSAVALYPAGTNESTSTWASTGMARSTSNLGQSSIPEDGQRGKGKAPAQDFAGYNPLTEPTSTLNTATLDQQSSTPSPPTTSPAEDPQRHLEESRLNINPMTPAPIPMPGTRTPHTRQLSNASSVASSMIDSAGTSFRVDSNMPSYSGSGLDLTTDGQASGTPPGGGSEPMFNFRSLAAMVGDEEKDRGGEHVEFAANAITQAEESIKEPSPSGSPITGSFAAFESSRKPGDVAESSSRSAQIPPVVIEDHDERIASSGGAGQDGATASHDTPDMSGGINKCSGTVNVAEQDHLSLT